MGFCFLFIALAFGVVKAYCGKRASFAASSPYDAVLINTFRMLCCVLIAFVVSLFGNAASIFCVSPKIILICLISGIAMAGFTVSWLLSVRSMAYMLVEVFVMGGTIIPLVLCALFYQEQIRGIQIFGIVLLVVAAYCICACKKTGKIHLTAKSFISLLLCALSSGMCDFTQKLYVKEIVDASPSLFNFYSYVFALAVLLIACPIFKPRGKPEMMKGPLATVKPVFHYVIIMAICLFFNAYFKTNAAKHVDAAILYPVYQGFSVILSYAMALLLFNEKISVKGTIGVALSIIAMIMINFASIV